MTTPTAGMIAIRLASAQRAGFATIEEHTEHKRRERDAMYARVAAERAQEAAERRRVHAPELRGFFLVSLGRGWWTVSEDEHRDALARAAECPGTEALDGVWMHRRADGRVVRFEPVA